MATNSSTINYVTRKAAAISLTQTDKKNYKNFSRTQPLVKTTHLINRMAK